jgi:hypothetical protein
MDMNEEIELCAVGPNGRFFIRRISKDQQYQGREISKVLGVYWTVQVWSKRPRRILLAAFVGGISVVLD